MTARSAAEAGSAPAPRRGLSLTSQILLGLAVGVLYGVGKVATRKPAVAAE